MFDLFKDLKTFTLPWTTKVLIVALLILSIGLNVGLFLYSWRQERSDLMSATVQFFGAVLPLLIVAIILTRASTGVLALRRRTEQFFLGVLPGPLTQVVEQQAEFYAPNPRRRPAPHPVRGSVLVNLTRGDCCADILVYVPQGGSNWHAVMLRLEINISRANLNVCVPRGLVAAANLDEAGEVLARAFRHSLGGAKAAPDTESYRFLDQPLGRVSQGGLDLVCLVGTRSLSEDFLWDSARQLQFAQDLMFMVRALLSEAPQYFPVVRHTGPPSSAQPYFEALTPPKTAA